MRTVGDPRRAGSPSVVLPIFLVLAYGWTWAGVFGAAGLGGAAGHPLHLVGLTGPLVATLVAARVGSGREYRRDLLVRTLDIRRLPPRWVGAALLVGAGPPFIAWTTVSVVDGRPPVGDALSAGAVVAAAAFAVAASLVEESGWRGLAQDHTAPSTGPLAAALVLGALWSLWHLPLYFLEGTYQHDLGIGTAEFWLSMATRVPLAVLFVWLLGSRGLVVAAVVAHAVGNLTGEVLPDGTSMMVVELAVVLAAAVTVAAFRFRAPPGRSTAARCS
jgi:uncharacterized protein